MKKTGGKSVKNWEKTQEKKPRKNQGKIQAKSIKKSGENPGKTRKTFWEKTRKKRKKAGKTQEKPRNGQSLGNVCIAAAEFQERDPGQGCGDPGAEGKSFLPGSRGGARNSGGWIRAWIFLECRDWGRECQDRGWAPCGGGWGTGNGGKSRKKGGKSRKEGGKGGKRVGGESRPGKSQKTKKKKLEKTPNSQPEPDHFCQDLGNSQYNSETEDFEMESSPNPHFSWDKLSQITQELPSHIPMLQITPNPRNSHSGHRGTIPRQLSRVGKSFPDPKSCFFSPESGDA